MNHSSFQVYKVTNTTTKRNYYGRSANAFERYVDYHLDALAKNTHYNHLMQADHVEGAWSFQLLRENLSQSAANALENKLAKQDPTRYNLTGIIGGNRFGVGRKLSDDDVRVIRDMYSVGAATQLELAKMFGVTQGLISLTVNLLLHCREEDYVPQVFRCIRKGAEHKEQIKEEYLNSKEPAKIKAKRIAQKYNITVGAVKSWVFLDPSTVRKSHSQNLSHGPKTPKVLINGVLHYSVSEWELENPEIKLHCVGPKVYVSRENRVIYIDGVAIKAGKSLAATLGAYGKTRRVGKYRYMTVTPEVRASKVQENRDKALAQAKKALETPVLFDNGKINPTKTAGKHQIPLRWIRNALSRLQ